LALYKVRGGTLQWTAALYRMQVALYSVRVGTLHGMHGQYSAGARCLFAGFQVASRLHVP